jgi:ElaB/YqjD/DUF883 family membrane-anchored ribosome-binding protein
MEKTNVSDRYAGNGSGLTKENLEEAFDAARDKVNQYGRALSSFVRERPAMAVMIALGAGYLVGRLLRR